jgi:hypothetical protein
MHEATEAAAERVIPRSRVNIGLDPALRGSLAGLANGRALVIDYFASLRCSVVIGDLTARFGEPPSGPGYVQLAAIDGVQVVVERRLVPVLRDGVATLLLAGPTFARHVSVRLDRPERWIDFLEQPGVLAGKRRFGRLVRWLSTSRGTTQP